METIRHERCEKYLFGCGDTLCGLGCRHGGACVGGLPRALAGAPSVSASTVQPGRSVTFSAGGFGPGSTVTVTDNGVVVGTATADANGVFVLAVTIGSVGTHTLTASGTDANGAPLSVTATVEGVLSGSPDGLLISGPGGSATTGGSTSGTTLTALPRTGSDLVVPGAVSGVALVLMGGTGVVVARRRHTDSLS